LPVRLIGHITFVKLLFFNFTIVLGVPIGNICANLFSGFIIAYVPGGWPNVFYCFGTITLVWLAVWLSIVYNDPRSHPFVSGGECKYLHETIGSMERKKVNPKKTSMPQIAGRQ